MTPYATTARRYLELGWKGPIPVGHGPKQKEPVPTGYTGREGTWPTSDQVEAWTVSHPNHNIAIRLPEHVIGIDVDDYGDKPGADTMTVTTNNHGLLPRTWISTSREGRSGIRWFRLSAPQNLPGKLVHPDNPDVSGVEIIQHGHRYAVVPPSIHPEGGQYRWITPEGEPSDTPPRPSDLPMVPDAWVDHIRKECSCWPYDWNKDAATSTSGRDPVAAAYDRWTRKMTSAYGRHDAALGGVLALVCFKQQEWPGADRYLTRLEQDFYQSLGDSRNPRQAKAEWERMVAGAEAKAHTTTIPKYEHRGGVILPSDQGETVREFGRNDSGNAELFAHLHGHRIRYVPRWDTWIVWDGTHWARDYKAVRVAEHAKDVGKTLLASSAEITDNQLRGKAFNWANQALGAGRIRSMIELTRGITGIPIDHEILDSDPWLLGVRNGVVDLRTGTYRKADPADLMTMQTQVEWDSDAECPRWLAALEEWFPNPETRSYVHRLVGQALVGLQRDHLFVIHFGTGGNGKGTFIRALQHVLGDYAATPDLGLLTQSKWGPHDSATATLFRARLAVASETEKRVKLAEASIKNLTGGDRIAARRLYENQWAFTPTHSLWLITNYQPEISGRDEGIWRRVKVVPWVTSFTRNPDKQLDEKLEEEAAGILRWAVQGVSEWQKHELNEPDEVVKATADYRSAEDLLGRFAADMGLVFHPELTIPKTEVATMLEEWAKTEGIRYAPKSDLTGWLADNGCSDSREYYAAADGRQKRRRVWEGVGLPKTGADLGEHVSGTDGTGSPQSPYSNPSLRDFTETASHASQSECPFCQTHLTSDQHTCPTPEQIAP